MEHVNSGQKLAIPAATFNCMVDAAKDFKARQSRQGGGDQVFTAFDPVMVLLTNPDGASFPRFHAAAIGEPAIPPDDQLSGGGMGSFFDAPNFEAALPAGTLTEKIAVIDEPIGTGDVETLNRAIISGCSICRIKVNNESEEFARTVAGETYLETATTGQFRILWKEAADAPDGRRWAFGVVNCDSATVAALGYNGYFRTVKQSDTSVFVGAPRGWSEESIDTVAGYVCFDDRMITIATDTLNFTHSDFVSLEVNIAAKTAILKTEHSFPSFSDNIIRVPVAYVEFDALGTKIQDVIQLQYGIVYLGAGGGYNGYFKVKTTDVMELAVVDGYSDTEPQCGYVRLDNNFYPVSATSAMTITGSGHVILTIDRSAAVVAPALSIRFADDDTDPFDFTAAPETDVIELPLAYVLVDDSGEEAFIAEIQQLQYQIPCLLNTRPYNGYFAVTDTSGALVHSVSVAAGKVLIQNYHDAGPLTIEVSESGYIALDVDATTGEVVTTLLFDAALDFAPETNHVQIPIAYIDFGSKIMPDGTEGVGIYNIKQLQYGTVILDLLKFPALIQDYDADKILVMVCDRGAYKWIVAGDCNASPSA